MQLSENFCTETNTALADGKTLKSFLGSLSDDDLKSIALGVEEENQHAHEMAQLASFLYGLAKTRTNCETIEELVRAIEALTVLASLELARRGRSEIDFFLSGPNPWDYDQITLVMPLFIKELHQLPFKNPTIIKISLSSSSIHH